MVDYKTRKKAIFCDIDGTLLKHDLLWDAETCKTLGLIDEII
tara:strand:- start:1330 stop:1455 length:126 start_codon:yes stop_codon:yes gene_type:complete